MAHAHAHAKCLQTSHTRQKPKWLDGMRDPKLRTSGGPEVTTFVTCEARAAVLAFSEPSNLACGATRCGPGRPESVSGCGYESPRPGGPRTLKR